MDIKELILVSPIASPLIAIIIQAIKQFLPEKLLKFLPVFSMIIGVGAVMVVNYGRSFGLNIAQAGVVGMLLGAGATGLYELVKNFKPDTIDSNTRERKNNEASL